MSTSRLSLSRRLAAVASLLALGGAGACAPPRNLESGLNSYSTDIVLGAQTKPAPPPAPIPVADLTPGFPSFIAPPPPPPLVTQPDAPPLPPPTTVPVVEVKCPQASLFDIPDPAGVDIGNPPKPGVYPYRQRGTWKAGADVVGNLPEETERVITDVVKRDDGTFSYKVAVSQFGTKTTTTYNVLKPSGQPDVDGIYITSIVHERADGAVEAFEPLGAQGAGYGLRILPLPASLARTWRSVASDPLRASSMSLEGLINEASRVDACGTVVEGWSAQVKIESRVFGKVNPILINATYVIAPHLGALIIGDSVNVDDNQPSGRVVQESNSLINRLSPIRPAP